VPVTVIRLTRSRNAAGEMVAFESICETCSYFQTSIEFRPALAAQHDHAATHGQTGRQELFARLLTQIDDNQAS
jgi:hypothetical protein